jgi:hypothetical protein
MLLEAVTTEADRLLQVAFFAQLLRELRKEARAGLFIESLP